MALGLIAAVAAMPTSTALAKSGRAKPVLAKSDNDQPLVLVVSLARQTLQVFRGTDLVINTRISSGRAGYRTPTGIYSILQKRRVHFSNLYDGAPMPFMQRLTWSGIALHAGSLPGYPASHGCIRLPSAVARRLFSMTDMGGRVIVSNRPLAPRTITHQALFRPLPPGEEAVENATAIGPVSEPGSAGSVRRIASSDGTSLVGLVRAPDATAATSSMTTAALPRRPRTQIEARRLREAERVGFETAIQTAKDKHAKAEAELTRLKTAIVEAQRAETDTSRKAARLVAMKAKAEAMVADARRILEREYAEFTPDTELPAERIAALAEREKALDELLMERASEVRIADTEHADAASALLKLRSERATIDARYQALRHAVVSSAKELATAEQDLKDYERRMRSRDQSISIFVSTKTGKVEIRQGFNVIHEAQAEILNSGTAIGTHVFTAVSLQGTRVEPALGWSVVTAETAGESMARALPRSSRGRDEPKSTAAAPATDSASSALSRLRMNEETHQLIAELIRPGSSLVITDRGSSNETGQYTDVIVDLR